MPTKYQQIKAVLDDGTKGFMANYSGPTTTGNPVYHVFPGLMGTTGGEERVLGVKYNHGQQGDGWRCFRVAGFSNIRDSPIRPPTVTPVDEAGQNCIDVIDHS